VKPGEAPPGSEFVFSGSGYQPDALVLRQKGEEPRRIPIEPGDGDTFEVRLIAGKRDSGTWTATAVDPELCRASVSFTVGLPPTAADAPIAPADQGLLMAGMAALGGLFIVSSLAFLPRITRSVRTR
jgi:hypothetical protein